MSAICLPLAARPPVTRGATVLEGIKTNVTWALLPLYLYYGLICRFVTKRLLLCGYIGSVSLKEWTCFSSHCWSTPSCNVTGEWSFPPAHKMCLGNILCKLLCTNPKTHRHTHTHTHRHCNTKLKWQRYHKTTVLHCLCDSVGVGKYMYGKHHPQIRQFMFMSLIGVFGVLFLWWIFLSNNCTW